MANLITKDKDTLTREQVTAIQASNSRPINFTPGSTLLAVVEAISTVVVWLESLILKVLGLTRASTSNGADLDSFYNDFGFLRNSAVAATGTVVFSRFTSTQQALIPIGAVVQTADGSQKYSVTADSTNSNYNSGLGGYVMGIGVSSISVPVTAQNLGAQANAVVGSINALAQAIPGVDTVNNTVAVVNGTDAESDTSYRSRFVGYLASLSKATKAAILFAVTSLGASVRATITENQSYSGAYQPGYFYVVVDDGSGNPSDNFIATISNAIEQVRPEAVTYGVFKPVILTANVSMSITTAAGYSHSALVSSVFSAISSAISALQLGQSLPYTRLAQIAYDVSPGITNVTGVTLNSGTSDVIANQKQVIRPGTITVT